MITNLNKHCLLFTRLVDTCREVDSTIKSLNGRFPSFKDELYSSWNAFTSEAISNSHRPGFIINIYNDEEQQFKLFTKPNQGVCVSSSLLFEMGQRMLINLSEHFFNYCNPADKKVYFYRGDCERYHKTLLSLLDILCFVKELPTKNLAVSYFKNKNYNSSIAYEEYLSRFFHKLSHSPYFKKFFARNYTWFASTKKEREKGFVDCFNFYLTVFIMARYYYDGEHLSVSHHKSS